MFISFGVNGVLVSSLAMLICNIEQKIEELLSCLQISLRKGNLTDLILRRLEI